MREVELERDTLKVRGVWVLPSVHVYPLLAMTCALAEVARAWKEEEGAKGGRGCEGRKRAVTTWRTMARRNTQACD
jgi:hypothetical protein